MDSLSDKENFSVLYHKYRNYLYAICHDILGNEQDAEDALQEAFFKIYKNMDKVSANGLDCNKTKSLIITITKNTAIDFYRKNRKRWLWEVDLEDSGILSQTQDGALQVKDESRLFAAINGLPTKYREILLLKYASGYSNREMSEILEIAETTVRMRISRGKKKLFTLLAQQKEDSDL